MGDLFDQWRKEVWAAETAAILDELLAAATLPECPVLAAIGFVIPEFDCEAEPVEGEIFTELGLSVAHHSWAGLEVPECFQIGRCAMT